MAQEAWPHQARGHNQTLKAIADGCHRVLVTSPTGGGKTKMMRMLMDFYLDRGLRVGCYINRRMLIEQMSKDLTDHGIEHGIRAAGHEDKRELPVQISSIQTEVSRVLNANELSGVRLHNADLVLIDEAHVQKGETVRRIIEEHRKEGASIIGYTASPIDLGDMYERLIIAGTNSELRKCGALVRAQHYGPDEPDLQQYKKFREEDAATIAARMATDPSERFARKAIMTSTIWGRVLNNWKALNPHGLPTILFAPGVGESKWFAEQFERIGVGAAHIDGSKVWVRGQGGKTSRQARADIVGLSHDGLIKVICNRFVMREGLNLPWLSHGILATLFNLQSYIQSGGRLLRSYPGKKMATIQDHGGHWWRLGSLNTDWNWNLNTTLSSVYGVRARRMREKREAEPFRCPRCGMIWMKGDFCNPDHGGCGQELEGRRSRPVVQMDGTMKEMHGDIFKPRRICQKTNAAAIWEQMYWRARSKKWDANFAQAEAMFAYENNWQWPSRELPLMPIDDYDFHRKVSMVPRDLLRP